MKRIKEFFDKWWEVMVLSAIIGLCLFALGCCVYTSIVANVVIGSLGILGVILACMVLVLIIYDEIKTNKEIKRITERGRKV